MAWTPVQVALAVLGAIVVYEMLRHFVVSAATRRQEARVDRFLRENRIPDDPFRHTHRVVVKERVLADPALVTAMVERAKADGTDVAAAEAKVRAWLDEIVPQFNLLAYYRVGYRLARVFAYGLYNVRLDKASLEAAMAHVPPNSAVVLVSNHRSNADFVVSGFMLSKSVQISYAVGEWARIWPLENLFKSFGSYFVRRGEKDPLYHRTLQSYVELITKQGVTQAMFPEGGLSRDGKLREAKLGLLDSMALAKRDPEFRRPLVFIPVGINFDRVLEDEVLVGETVGGDHPLKRRGLARKAVRLFALTGRALVGVPVNVFRFATKRLKKHGVCAIHFGEPLVLDDWLDGPGKAFLAEDDRRLRQTLLRPVGEDLMARIGRSIPVTPCTAVAAAMSRIGLVRMDQAVEAGVLKARLRQVLDELAAAGAPLFIGNPYVAKSARDPVLADERRDLDDVGADIDAEDALHRIIDGALDVMSRRGLLIQEGTRLRTKPERWPLVEYYANSLASHFKGGPKGVDPYHHRTQDLVEQPVAKATPDRGEPQASIPGVDRTEESGGAPPKEESAPLHASPPLRPGETVSQPF